MMDNVFYSLLGDKVSIDLSYFLRKVFRPLPKDPVPDWLAEAIEDYLEWYHRCGDVLRESDHVLVERCAYNSEGDEISAGCVYLFVQGATVWSIGVFGSLLLRNHVELGELKKAYDRCREDGECFDFEALMSELLW